MLWGEGSRTEVNCSVGTRLPPERTTPVTPGQTAGAETQPGGETGRGMAIRGSFLCVCSARQVMVQEHSESSE